MIARFFIQRPIFASVISIVLVLCGAVAYFTLPTTQYPDITPPTIEVSTIYPGANAELVRDTIAAPIEQQVIRLVLDSRAPSPLFPILRHLPCGAMMRLPIKEATWTLSNGSMAIGVGSRV